MSPQNRRAFVKAGSFVAASLFVPELLDSQQSSSVKNTEELEVTPNEDLMREHGLLRRVLFIYDESAMRLSEHTKGKPNFDPSVVTSCADIVRKFIEDYHEMLEQQHVFPRLQKAGKLNALVNTLLEQHRIGRLLTDKIRQSASGSLRNKEDAHALADAIQKFQRMYRPHAAWEDTVLFPAFKATLSQSEYDSLGEDFEKVETQKFGEEGFEHVLAQVADLEKKLGIDNPSHYTPQV